jgi:histone-binding protein RBBP4
MGLNRAVGLLDGDARARIWKETHVPLLYDWISSRKLLWPHAAMQWGHTIRSEHLRNRPTSSGLVDVANYTTRALYLAERTGDASDPNTLLYFDVRITTENTSVSEDVAKPWCDESIVNARSDGMSTPEFWLRKRIIHPGEVNKIRTLLPGVVVTHTDRPDLYVWDFARQESRKKDDPKDRHNSPTCTLTGHTSNAEYAMSVAVPIPDSADAWVASGGSDKRVLVWRLLDYETMGKNIRPWVSFKSDQAGKNGNTGHSATVEDVSFSSQDRNILASVGRDQKLLVWDIRQPAKATSAVLNAHNGDINACDFGGVNAHGIATGGSDKIVRVWDSRKLVNSSGTGVPLEEYKEHGGQINSIMWNKYVPNVLASCADDGQVLVWDTSLGKRPGVASVQTSPGLLFRHVGHNLQRERATVVDFEWLPDPDDPWCIGTISEMIGDCGGSTLQIWRISSMIYASKEAVAAELRNLPS